MSSQKYGIMSGACITNWGTQKGSMQMLAQPSVLPEVGAE